MTILEALGSMANYPVDEAKLKRIAISRGLNEAEIFTADVASSKAFELATAEVYVLLVSSANIAEGGFSISMTDKSNMLKLASGIFSKYGVSNPLKPKIRNRSNYW